MAPGLLQLRILGKVVKKPDRINSVMNIMIEDEEGEQIQCCFFTDTV
jgi:Trm5-related predicted tRNA methylase